METRAMLLPLGPMARLLRVPARWLSAEADARRVPHLKADNVLLFGPETVERVLLDRARRKGVKHAS
jgi:hypothetical protein